MKSYINTRLVKAKEISLGEYNKLKGWNIPEDKNPNEEGYFIDYSNGYTTWQPKEQFEAYSLELNDNPKLPSGVSVDSKMVDDFIKKVNILTIGDKTTLVRVTLANGFEIIESSACVDKDNYSEEIGAECCLEKIKDKVWYLLGFLLQTAYKNNN